MVKLESEMKNPLAPTKTMEDKKKKFKKMS